MRDKVCPLAGKALQPCRLGRYAALQNLVIKLIAPTGLTVVPRE